MLYAECTVNYDGRAKSTLENGKHLIIHKNDGTLLIHGGRLCTPLNYQPPGAIMYKKKNKLISKRNNEIIIIAINEIITYEELHQWSAKKIAISKTEKELRDHIVAHFYEIFGFHPVEIYIEFATPVGHIDILAIDEYNIYHVIEVKRGKASLASCSQLERYSNYFIDIMKTVRDYLTSPDISKGALNYAKKVHQTWLKVEHTNL